MTSGQPNLTEPTPKPVPRCRPLASGHPFRHIDSGPKRISESRYREINVVELSVGRVEADALFFQFSAKDLEAVDFAPDVTVESTHLATAYRGKYMTSPETAKAISLFRKAKTESQSATNADEFRVWYEDFTGQFEVPEDASIEQVGVGDLTAEWISAP